MHWQSNRDMTPFSLRPPWGSILWESTYHQLQFNLQTGIIPFPIKKKVSKIYIVKKNSLLASSPDPSPGKVTFKEAEFFSLSVPEEEKFDLAYDYT